MIAALAGVGACGRGSTEPDHAPPAATSPSGRVEQLASSPSWSPPGSPPSAGPCGSASSTEPTIPEPIFARYLALGGRDALGAPLAPADSNAAGPLQRFERGCVAPDGSGELVRMERCDPAPDLTPTLERLRLAVPARSPGSDLAISVTWLPTGQHWSSAGDAPRVSASCAKWVWAAAALHRASIAEVAPAAQLAFGQSDNVRGRMLIDLAGGADAVNAYTQGILGVPKGALGLCRFTADQTRTATNCDRSVGHNSFFTTDGATTFLAGVYRGEGLGRDKRDALLAWAKLMPNGGFSIGHLLPRAVEAAMAHKRGELPTGCCGQGPGESWTAELAIVPTPRGAYAIAISLSRAHVYARQLEAIEWASCAIYEALIGDIREPGRGCGPP